MICAFINKISKYQTQQQNRRNQKRLENGDKIQQDVSAS